MDESSIVNPRVKICCIQSEEEAHTAVRLGASALGLVSEMPSGPGVIPEDRIAAIAKVIPPGISAFLLTSRQDVDSIVAQQRRTGVDTLQLVDKMPTGAYAELRRCLPGIRIVQVIHVVGEDSVEEAVSVAPQVDVILLDSGNPSSSIKELGGTGRVHDWALSRRIRDKVSKPVFLAGGLNPSNVREAVLQVAPFGLDVCSGVRTDGRLDEGKVVPFIRNGTGVTAPSR
jgi:phosphoribosylanthranilate isomerase